MIFFCISPQQINFINVVPPLHPLYISVTEINHNEKDKTLEVSCKIFTNDFEYTLEKAYNSKMDLSQPKDKTAVDKFISEYIRQHLRIKVNGEPVTMQFIGSEKETDATWSYFQVNNISTMKRIDIFNNLLYDAYEGQINIIHVSEGGNRKSTKLNNPDANASFEF